MVVNKNEIIGATPSLPPNQITQYTQSKSMANRTACRIAMIAFNFVYRHVKKTLAEVRKLDNTSNSNVRNVFDNLTKSFDFSTVRFEKHLY